MIESQLISVPEAEYNHRVQNFTRIRDYLALCRGESLVTNYTITCSDINTQTFLIK